MSIPIQHHQENQSITTNTLKHVLRPIVKLMIKQSVTYTLVSDLLKVLFVEEAEKELASTEKRLSDARISLVTGVHRKDVKRLRDDNDTLMESMPDNVSLGIQIVGRWHADSQFLDEHGAPMPLVRTAEENVKTSFESLVRTVSKDIHPRAVLDEWLRLGVAYLDENDYVVLKNDIFIPEDGWKEKMFFLSNNLEDHANAAVHNVCNLGKPFLERCVHFDGINADRIASIAKLAEKLSMKALREVNQKVLADAEIASEKPTEKMRMTYGVYMYYTPSNKSESAPTLIDNENNG